MEAIAKAPAEANAGKKGKPKAGLHGRAVFLIPAVRLVRVGQHRLLGLKRDSGCPATETICDMQLRV